MTDVFTDGRVVLDATLTVRDAPTALATLREMTGRHQAVSIDCSAAPEIDLSFIQMLLAARASAAKAGRSVTLAEAPSGALLNTLTRGGFRAIQDNAAGATAYWFAGAAA